MRLAACFFYSLSSLKLNVRPQKTVRAFMRRVLPAGRITAIDADGDGYTELFVPSYYENTMYVYTFAPESL